MSLIYCTIATASQLAHVLLLESTLRKFHPDAEVRILLLETPSTCRRIEQELGKQVYSPEQVGCSTWLQMAFAYNLYDYANSLKPSFIRTLASEGHDRVVYFNPAIAIYGHLTDILDCFEDNDLVLTPYISVPVINGSTRMSLSDYYEAGMFSPDFIGVKITPDTIALLEWWQNCLRFPNDSLNQLSRTEMFCMSFFPSFAGSLRVVRDPSYNVAHWNIFQRTIDHDGEKWLSNGEELKFFNFNGISSEELNDFASCDERMSVPKGSPLQRIIYEYSEKLVAQNLGHYSDAPNSFATYANGEPITENERLAYNRMDSELLAAINDPFSENSGGENRIRLYAESMRNATHQSSTRYLAIANDELRNKLAYYQQSIIDMRNSLSWKITAPLRLLHAKSVINKHDSSE